MTFFPALRRSLLLAFALSGMLRAQDGPAQLDGVTITANRLPGLESGAPFSSVVVERQELQSAPQLRLDDVLRNAVPGFSLFRRSSSRVANPTTQGVSLRNVGPNGAGRTLVLLDGIPLNDPFAGWVPWGRVPPASLERVIVNPGGGAGLFGNAALAGTIHLVPREAREGAGELRGTIGERDTLQASLDARVVSGDFAFATFVDRFSTGGYPVLQEDQRGRGDTPATADSWTWQGQMDARLGEYTRLALTAAVFEEERSNGTHATRNSTRGQDFSATFEQRMPGLDADFRVQAYVQRRGFRSLFSSVNAERSAETPALDQFDVPATAAGGSAVWSQQIAPAHRVVAGVDARWIEGETNEHFRFMDDGFTRTRNAGGRQFFAGAFLEDHWQVNEAVRVVAGGRVDYWRQYDGLRIERERATGDAIQDATFSDRDGVAPNARLGLTAKVSRHTQVRAAAYTGFRIPTLNELYRPFRVGNDVTEANAELDPERLYGAEIGVTWEPIERFSFALTGFANRLDDAVGNVTLAATPDGGALRQRRNLDHATVLGLEASAECRPTKHWRLRAQYLYTHATVGDRRLAQTPEHLALASLEWTPGPWHLAAQARFTGRQYEDDLNTLQLAPFVTADLALGYTFHPQLTATAKVENVFDAESEVGKTASGLVSIGAPRLFSLTVSVRF